MLVSEKIIQKHAKQYYKDLENYAKFNVDNESTTEMAFKSLLKQVGDEVGYVLLKNHESFIDNKKIIPDGIIRGEFGRYIGYWEAKDSNDDLDEEIYKKLKKGYPRSNTIFEDTKTAVLYQNDKEAGRFDLSELRSLVDLLLFFFNYNEPQRVEFKKAVEEFKQNIPRIGSALSEIISRSKKRNREFKEALIEFLELCAQSFNKSVDSDEVEDMLVQHLLTERIFRKVFDNPDFIRRNVIARELEKLVICLTKDAFDRNSFFREIDFFYVTIEKEASNISDFTEKQSFLNEIYELFFKSYSKKNADRNGIVYTPQPIVKFMVKFTNGVLENEFGKSFSSAGVNIIDPCVGTGNFVIEILKSIKSRNLETKYRAEIFCNENMLLAYYVASVNIEYFYYKSTGEYVPFENIVFTNTLELIEDPGESLPQQSMEFLFNKVNTERAKRELESELKVILGNPPYRGSQTNEMENNKSSKTPVIDAAISRTYSGQSKAQLKNKLYDPYVKFFRWASNRLDSKNGIICFISNNSFMFDTMFDGMRACLIKDFNRIYHFNLGGDISLNPKLSGTVHNVFGIQLGVGITFLIRNEKYSDSKVFYKVMDEFITREEKLEILASLTEKHESIEEMEWAEGYFNGSAYVFGKSHIKSAKKYEVFTPFYTEDGHGVFQEKLPGLSTNRTEWVYEFDAENLKKKISKSIRYFNSEVERLEEFLKKSHNQIGKLNIDKFVDYKQEDKIKWSDGLKRKLKQLKKTKFEDEKVVQSLFRPYIKKLLYYDTDIFVDRPSNYSEILSSENLLICVNGLGQQKSFSSLMTNLYPEIQTVYNCQVYPLFIYENGRKTYNISKNMLDYFKTNVGRNIGEEDIFFYVYGMSHHKTLRSEFESFFKSEIPRVPISKDSFKFISKCGKELSDIHVNFETAKPHSKVKVSKGSKPNGEFNIENMRFSKDRLEIIYNESISISLPDGVHEYKINGRSPIEWVVDQYYDYPSFDDKVIDLISKLATVSLNSIELINGISENNI